jgi:hypothetical protein
MTHDEDIATHRAVMGKIAQRALAGEIDILDAARQIVSVRHRCDLDFDDEDIAAFVVIESDTDNLPIGDERENWAVEALARKAAEVEAAQKWAWNVAEESLRNLITRFGV